MVVSNGAKDQAGYLRGLESFLLEKISPKDGKKLIPDVDPILKSDLTRESLILPGTGMGLGIPKLRCKIFESSWGSPILVGDEDGDVKLFRMGMGEDIGMKSGNGDVDWKYDPRNSPHIAIPLSPNVRTTRSATSPTRNPIYRERDIAAARLLAEYFGDNRKYVKNHSRR
ncbi:hypothetical protein Tco_0111900 [Tanacetum coccineum]